MMVSGGGRFRGWLQNMMNPELEELEPVGPLPPVIEALARQRALAEQRLRVRPEKHDRRLEEGRRMGIIEVAKELGVHDDVTIRTHELRRRR